MQSFLSRHVQWVYVPAVKDATDEEVEGRTTALGLLLQRTIRSKVDFAAPIADLKNELGARYQAILKENQGVLSDLSESIETRLRNWSHPGARVAVDWSFDPDRSLVVQEPVARVTLGEGAFLGELARLGHGLQRSFIVALLTEVAATQAEGEPTLILGFEEPELYQHPPQARHLAAVLERLTEGEGQVLVTTHSPYFVSGRGFESVRMTAKDPATGTSSVTSISHDSLSASLADALGTEPAPTTEFMMRVEQVMQPSRNEMFFSRLPVLVEGPEGVAFISTQLHLRDEWEKFRRHGMHFIVCGGKTNMSRPLAIAEGLGIPAYVVFDADFDERGKEEEQHRRDNRCLLTLAGLPDEDAWSAETLRSQRLTMFGSNLSREVVDEIGAEAWNDAKEAAREAMGITGCLSKKNALWITATLEHLQKAGVRVALLDEVCSSLLEYGRSLEAVGEEPDR